MFSFPAGIPSVAGKGKTTGEITSEKSDKRGERIERFLGVVTTEMVNRPVEARWWVRSKMGIKWPCAGYGIIKMWVGWSSTAIVVVMR